MRSYIIWAIAACLLLVCDCADRRRPGASCPVCTGNEPIPPEGEVAAYYVLAKFDTGSMHGLWPNNCNPCPRDYPLHCGNTPFDINKIPQKTLDLMYVDWKSGVGPNKDFWEHEWTCHGTCSGLEIGDYFTKAMNAFYNSPNQVHTCFVIDSNLDLHEEDCPTACRFEPPQNSVEGHIGNVSMLKGRETAEVFAAPNKYCAPRSGTCRD